MRFAKFVSSGALLAASFVCQAQHASAEDSVYWALAARHPGYSIQDLEKAAGGEDALVKRLIELRNDQSMPHVSIRAENLLLEYSDRPDVQSVLESDLRSSKRQGLARVVAGRVGQVKDPALRARLSGTVLERAKREAQFVPYAKNLRSSGDPVVQKMAREAFPSTEE